MNTTVPTLAAAPAAVPKPVAPRRLPPPVTVLLLTTALVANEPRRGGGPGASLVADFEPTVTIGPGPLLVQFCDLSTTTAPGGIISWAWDFDGDAIVDSFQQHPVFVYLPDGDYTVSLTVSDGVNPPQQRTRVAGIRVEPAATGACAALLFDRSSTMANVRSGTNVPRAVDTIDFGEDDLDWLFLTPGMRVLLYECHDGGTTRIGGSYTTAAAAKAAIQALPAPSGDKPLAHAIRSVVADLVALSPGGSAANRRLLIYSDDGPNTNPASCQGFGPDSVGGDSCAQALFQGPLGAFDTGSWQQAVCDLIAANVALDVYYFSMFADAVGNDAFFRAVCELSGGAFTGIPDASTMPRRNPWRSSGRGCADHRGVVLRMLRDGIPQLGQTVQIGCRTGSGMPCVLGIGFSDEVAGANLLPYDLGPIGAPGCWLRSSWDVTDGVIAAGGFRFLPVPNVPALAGLQLFLQAAELHPANNALGIATSDLLRLQIVP